MSKRLKIVISVSLVGFVLVMFSVIQSPSAKAIVASLVSLTQYLVTNSGRIITSPACYGSIGLLILLFVASYLPRFQRAERRKANDQARQQRREAREQASQQRQADFERRMQELRESKNPIKKFAGKVIESVDEKINPNIRLPQTFETWERWQRYYSQYRIIKTNDKRLNEKEILARLCSELSTDSEIVEVTDKTMRDIRKAGEKSYLTSWEKYCEMTNRPVE